MVALPVIAASREPPNLALIFLNTILSAMVNFKFVKNSDLPFPASSRFFLAALIPIKNNFWGRPPVSSIFAKRPA